MRVGRQEMETVTAQRRVATALKHISGVLPNPIYEFGDKVRMWTEDSQKYEGPYIVHSYDNKETVFVHIGNKIAYFSTPVVKPVHTDETNVQQTEEASIPPDNITELRTNQSAVL